MAQSFFVAVSLHVTRYQSGPREYIPHKHVMEDGLGFSQVSTLGIHVDQGISEKDVKAACHLLEQTQSFSAMSALDEAADQAIPCCSISSGHFLESIHGIYRGSTLCIHAHHGVADRQVTLPSLLQDSRVKPTTPLEGSRLAARREQARYGDLVRLDADLSHPIKQPETFIQLIQLQVTRDHRRPGHHVLLRHFIKHLPRNINLSAAVVEVDDSRRHKHVRIEAAFHDQPVHRASGGKIVELRTSSRCGSIGVGVGRGASASQQQLESGQRIPGSTLMRVAPDHGVPHEEIRMGNLVEHATGVDHAEEGRGRREERNDSADSEGVLYEASADRSGVDLSELLLRGAALEEEQDDASMVSRAPWLVGCEKSLGFEAEMAHVMLV
ncbi:hypothetical protein MUK42_33673 [Musa troglodytarum]|uniref:Uncharacterized protein n=1 Tax=Musa troglodytarum TaxID=320322 RepID=A0A9E7EDN2_9LILI|nr:hypothetical protein MUK42_33673 [Musa troglodytarum]